MSSSSASGPRYCPDCPNVAIMTYAQVEEIVDEAIDAGFKELLLRLRREMAVFDRQRKDVFTRQEVVDMIVRAASGQGKPVGGQS